MEAASLILSVVALIVGLVVAGFGIWFQYKLSEGSSRQLTEAQSVLSKLEGVSLQLRETQQGQFGMMLEAVLHVPTQILSQGVGQLPAPPAQPALGDASSKEIEDLRQALYNERVLRLIFGSQLALLRELNQAHGLPVETARITYFEMHVASANQYNLTPMKDIQTYVDFLETWQLVRIEDGKYFITSYGINFLVYVTQWGLVAPTIL